MEILSACLLTIGCAGLLSVVVATVATLLEEYKIRTIRNKIKAQTFVFDKTCIDKMQEDGIKEFDKAYSRLKETWELK